MFREVGAAGGALEAWLMRRDAPSSAQVTQVVD